MEQNSNTTTSLEEELRSKIKYVSSAKGSSLKEHQFLSYLLSDKQSKEFKGSFSGTQYAEIDFVDNLKQNKEKFF